MVSEAVDAAEIEVGPTEDTVLALLELLVEPLLPSRSAVRENPSPSQEEAVAKQMHAVVLLYNYYHRKCRPNLELLEFDSFCKLAVVLKPNLYSYMKLMKLANYHELNDLDKQLSLTENMMMEACDISTSLDASKDIPVIEGWPISKVAIFLVDAQKENCYLLHGIITQGVWSLIEKEFYSPKNSSEPSSEGRVGKRRITKKQMGQGLLLRPKVNQNVDESNLQQLAFSAVKDACGFGQSDLRILEGHVVYSLSKEKSATHFYIMQCMQPNQDANVVPIRDAVESLQAPLVRKESHGWTTTPAVEYFHLLPYADIVSDWLSRGKLQNALQGCETGSKAEKQNSSQGPEEPQLTYVFVDRGKLQNALQACETGSKPENENRSLGPEEPRETVVYKKRSSSQKNCILGENPGSKASNADGDHLRQGDNEFVVTASLDNIVADEPYLAGSVDDEKNRKSPDEDHIDDQKSMITSEKSDQPGKTNCSLDDGKSRNFPSEDHVDDQKNMITLEKSDLPAKTNGTIVPTHIIEESANTCEHRIKEFSENIISKAFMSDQDVEQDRALVAHDPSSKQVDKVHLTIASKEKLLSQAALKVLHRKREMLCHQLRNIEDEIALCDRNIQTILSVTVAFH
ncbi:hypothetical protein Ancab_030088 [Ancistrocladus abbreviatus]